MKFWLDGVDDVYNMFISLMPLNGISSAPQSVASPMKAPPPDAAFGFVVELTYNFFIYYSSLGICWAPTCSAGWTPERTHGRTRDFGSIGLA